MKKNILLFGKLTIVFTVLLFVGKIFFGENVEDITKEEKYLDQSVYENTEKESQIDYIQIAKSIIEDKTNAELLSQEEKDKRIEEIEKLKNKYISKKLQDLEEKKQQAIEEENELSAARQIHFAYIPKEFISSQLEDSKKIAGVLKNKIFEFFYSRVNIEMHEERPDVRGKMKNKTVKLFGPQNMRKDELFGVFIHEFAHYIDLYFFERNAGYDTSNTFYDISWYSTVVLLPGQAVEDFVSGYSMINKYEDFAESLAYFVFHNDDFFLKAQKSGILLEKYQFFTTYIFPNGEFQNTDFSLENEVKDYYRDVTKINFSLNNFLQYLEKEIY